MKSPEYISEEELKYAVELSLENAEQFIKDAEMLIENSSFGHAYAFGVLACEELGKAVICTIAVFSYRFENKNLIKNELLESKNKNKNLLINHVIKHNLVKIIYELHERISQLLDIEESEMEISSESDLTEIFTCFTRSPEKWKEFIKVLDAGMSKAKKELYDFFEKQDVNNRINETTLEKNKWRGLYVDYKEKKFISPKIVRPDDTTEFLARTKGSFEILKMACIMILATSDSDALTEELAALVGLI